MASNWCGTCVLSDHKKAHWRTPPSGVGIGVTIGFGLRPVLPNRGIPGTPHPAPFEAWTPRLCWHIGDDALDSALRNSVPYDCSYDHLYKLLPDCNLDHLETFLDEIPRREAPYSDYRWLLRRCERGHDATSLSTFGSRLRRSPRKASDGKSR